ncbi:MAG TPA: sulfurtransferase-like selenium metabolism protein YedF [Bacteroidales bacterium]|nr:sulfurtransferase-like selenium metabolism protein YedF [Bacteroidales bacterium]
MKTIDAKGKQCPMPLIMAKKALEEIAVDETLEILIDNETSLKNVTRFLEDNGMKTIIQTLAGVFHLFVNKTGEFSKYSKSEDYCEISTAGTSDYVIAFQRNFLGDGDPELGKILLKAFINTLPEIENKPSKLLFLNSGIFLTLKDAVVLDSLKKLESDGVEILVCGTCLDFYKKKDEVGVGMVSNMYDILNRLSMAGSVIYP